MRPYLVKLKVPEFVLELFDKHFLLFSLAVIALGVTVAFFGYKLFKSILVIGGAVAAGYAANKWLIPLFVDKLPEVPLIELADVIVILAAALGALIAFNAKKAVVFAGAGVGTYFLFDKFLFTIILPLFPENWTFMSNKYVKIAVCVLCALIIAIFVELYFKLIFIAGTSLGGMAAAAVFVANLILIDINKEVLIIAACAGAAVGLIAAYVQFQMNPRYKQIF